MSTQNSLRQYEEKINQVVTYICQHTGHAISLAKLAGIACFSKYHFLRIFKALVNETAGEFIRRIRIEKAAYFLIYNPASSITEIALDCGFSTSQNFAKAFKGYYHMSPSVFREHSQDQPFAANSNPGNMKSKHGNAASPVLRYTDLVAGKTVRLKESKQVAKHVTIEDYDEVQVAYIRKNENYTVQTISAACEQLLAWARLRKLARRHSELRCVYWDNVAVTPVDKRRFDVCLLVDQQTNVSAPVHKQILVGGKVAVYRCLIKNGDFYTHWTRFLKYWFPTSGFVPDDRPCFERIHNLFAPNAKKGLQVEICIPIKEL